MATKKERIERFGINEGDCTGQAPKVKPTAGESMHDFSMRFLKEDRLTRGLPELMRIRVAEGIYKSQ